MSQPLTHDDEPGDFSPAVEVTSLIAKLQQPLSADAEKALRREYLAHFILNNMTAGLERSFSRIELTGTGRK